LFSRLKQHYHCNLFSIIVNRKYHSFFAQTTPKYPTRKLKRESKTDFKKSSVLADGAVCGGTVLKPGQEKKGNRWKKKNDTWYTTIRYDGKFTETDDKNEDRLALRQGLEVTKNSRRVFISGNSDIRLYVSTEIFKAKDL